MSYHPQANLPSPPDYGENYIYQGIWNDTHYIYWHVSMGEFIYVEIALLYPVTEIPKPNPPTYPGYIFEEIFNGTHYVYRHILHGNKVYVEIASVEVPNPHDSTNINMMTCSQCGHGQIDMILQTCRHPYHLNCFNNFCNICQYEVLLPALNKKDPSTCNFCTSKENLLTCQTCQKMTCFLCVNLKPLSDCCKSIIGSLGNFFSTCPGCEYEVAYSDFLPLKCSDHGLMCKKCTILGYRLGKCIMGCELRFKFNEYIKCQSCNRFEPAYLGHNKCGMCEVCDSCQWIHNMKESWKGLVSCVMCEKAQ
jgi:hypothetical protein